MPIVDREIADRLVIDATPDGSIWDGCRHIALLGMGPAVLLFNILAHERRWQKTYLPKRAINRATALQTEHEAAMFKIIRAKQGALAHWTLALSNIAAIGLLFIVMFFGEMVLRIFHWCLRGFR